MRLFDLHCDTLSEAYEKNESLRSNSCHVDTERALSSFDEYKQVFAIWSRHELSEDECYDRCLKILDYADLQFKNNKEVTPIYAVEGAKLLNGNIDRLMVLKSRNVKILTLVWYGVSCIGGAFDNNMGLTDFGREAVEYCLNNGIVPDLSHSNDVICEQALDIAGRCGAPVIASHSCSRYVFNHPRNVSDVIASKISKSGGVIGVNFVSDHLGGKSTDVILSHIDHLINVCGKKAVCLGGDLDGMGNDSLPCEIRNVADVSVLFDAISKKYHSETFADEILYLNAADFSKRRMC
jgi:membrane dipeptidase